jgi:hypothetical protein
MTTDTTEKFSPAYYCQVLAMRTALAHSDKIDALIGDYGAEGNEDPNLTQEQLDDLRVQQHAAWALVRNLCFDMAGTSDFHPHPLSVDVGTALIVVFGNQDDGGCPRNMDAGWIASRRIVRPQPAPEWADKKEELEGEAGESSDPDAGPDEGSGLEDNPLSHESIQHAVNVALAARKVCEDSHCGDVGPEASYESACWERVRTLVLAAAELMTAAGVMVIPIKDFVPRA